MEHYRKVSSKYVEDALSSNEIRVVPSTKQNDFANKAVEMLNAHLDVGVVFSGCGDDCSKVITLVEQLKRKITQSTRQSTTIKYTRIEDLWESDMEGLDNLKVVRHIPVLNITLVASEPVSFKISESRDKNRGGRQTYPRSHSKPKTQSQIHSKPQSTKTRTTSK